MSIVVLLQTMMTVDICKFAHCACSAPQTLFVRIVQALFPKLWRAECCRCGAKKWLRFGPPDLSNTWRK